MKTKHSICIAASMMLSVVYGNDAEQKPTEGTESILRHVETGRIGQRTKKDMREFHGEIEAVERSPLNAMRKASRVFSDGDVRVDAVTMSRADQLVDLSMVEVRKDASARDASQADPRALMTSPVPGSTLNATQTFTWTEGYRPEEYWLWVGSCQDCTDIVDGGVSLLRYATVNLPTDGRVLYVTLFTYFQGDWYWADYQYRASTPGGLKAEMTSPARGSTLAATQLFQWTAGRSVQEYYLWVGSCQDCTDILDENEELRLSRSVNIPADGRVIYVTLFSYVNGDWQWVDYQFRAPANSTTNCRINMTNKLGYGITLLVNGAAQGVVPAFETRYKDLACPANMVVGFSLNRPTLSGRELGDTMAGQWNAIARPSGTINFTVDNVVGSQTYFVPYITNRTAVGMLLEVNGGLQSENRCNCVVGANKNDVAAGYYRLYTNSNVRLWRDGSGYTGSYRFFGTNSDGRVATGGTLPQHVESESGILRLIATVAP